MYVLLMQLALPLTKDNIDPVKIYKKSLLLLL